MTQSKQIVPTTCRHEADQPIGSNHAVSTLREPREALTHAPFPCSRESVRRLPSTSVPHHSDKEDAILHWYPGRVRWTPLTHPQCQSPAPRRLETPVDCCAMPGIWICALGTSAILGTSYAPTPRDPRDSSQANAGKQQSTSPAAPPTHAPY